MLNWHYIFTARSKNLMETLKFEELQILGEIYKQYIISKDKKVLELQGNFSKFSVYNVLEQLGIECNSDTVEVIVFPNSTTTTIKFK